MVELSSHIKELLKKYHLKIVYKDMKGNGYLVNVPKRSFSFIFVNSRLSDKQAKKVILHEIGHVIAGDSGASDYKYNYITRLKSESRANNFMADEEIKHCLALGNEIEGINYINLADYLGLSDYGRIKAELLKLNKMSKER